MDKKTKNTGKVWVVQAFQCPKEEFVFDPKSKREPLTFTELGGRGHGGHRIRSALTALYKGWIRISSDLRHND